MPSYENENQLKAAAEDVPAFRALDQRFTELNDIQDKYISEISHRLHSIINLNTPEKEIVDHPGDQPVNDVFQKLYKEVGRISTSNKRLEKILTHLCKII